MGVVNYTRVNNRFFIYFVANGLMYVQVCIRSVKFRINKRVSYIHVQSLKLREIAQEIFSLQ